MGLFSNKKDQASLEAAHDLDMHPADIARMTPKQRRELQAKMDGKVKKTGDLAAGMKDLRQGKKGVQRDAATVKDAKKNTPLNRDGTPRSSWW